MEKNMDIKEIFDLFEKVGCLTFATINGDYPETRIAHFLTYDEEGLYFFTMDAKPFYKQLKETGKLSVCGLSVPPQVEWVDEDTPYSAPGFFIRATGDVREFTIEEAKAKDPEHFKYLIEDHKRYPRITGFCLYNFHGEIYDYDFEKENRENKLLRERFTFGSMKAIPVGLRIDKSKCISCGKCKQNCSFLAITQDDDGYRIMGERCDECGNCYNSCPADAVIHKGLIL